MNGYPRWDDDKPSSVQINNALKVIGKQANKSYHLFWNDASNRDLAGFICERQSEIQFHMLLTNALAYHGPSQVPK